MRVLAAVTSTESFLENSSASSQRELFLRHAKICIIWTAFGMALAETPLELLSAPPDAIRIQALLAAKVLMLALSVLATVGSRWGTRLLMFVNSAGLLAIASSLSGQAWELSPLATLSALDCLMRVLIITALVVSPVVHRKQAPGSLDE